MPQPGMTQYLVSILQECRKRKCLKYAMIAYTCIWNEGLENRNSVGEYIVPMFVECGSILDAQSAFNWLVDRNERTWSSLVLGYIEFGQLQHALSLYQKMRKDGIYASSFTLVGVLKACRILGEPERGRQFYLEAAEKESQNGVVLNSLISMYAKCGLMPDAFQAFESLKLRTVVSWTAMITGYAEHGPSEEALKCFSMMQKVMMIPNAFTFSSVLKACGNVEAYNEGKQIHVQIAKLGVEGNLSVGNALVGMYAKCGLLLEAKAVFDKLAERDVVSWTSLIGGYSEDGCEERALSLFEDMQSEGIALDSFIIACVLKACGNLKNLDKGQDLHRLIILEEVETEPSLGNSLIGMYAKCGSLSQAQDVFDELQNRNTISWATLVATYSDNGSNLDALKLFNSMQNEGASPNDAIFICALQACSLLGNSESGRRIHTEVVQVGYEGDCMLSSTLLDMYSKCGLLLEAHAIFERLGVRNIVAWTALIGGYAEYGLCLQALHCYESMQEEGIAPNAATYISILKACGNVGAVHKGISLHFEILCKSLEEDQSVSSSLLCMYVKCGCMARAQDLFQTCFTHDVSAWSSMIHGYGLHHDAHMALSCFKEMQKHGVKPNAITFTCLLAACSHANLVREGWGYFKSMIEEYGIMPTVEHYTCMVDILARSGHLYDAEQFLEMSRCQTSEKTWATLLTACKTHGEVRIGVKSFKRLVQLNSECGKQGILSDIESKARRDGKI